MISDILITAAAALIIYLFIWLLRGIVLTPVPLGKNMESRVVLSLRGPAPELEQTVNALDWLRRNGTLRMGIYVENHSADPDTARVAEFLAREGKIELN